MIREQELRLGPGADQASTPLALAVRDVISGLRLFPVWGMLGWHDIRQRYRRSVIGPFWLTISTAIMVMALSFLYSGLFRADMAEYVAYIAVGMIVWTFVSTVSNDACQVFISADGMIKQIRLPFTVHVCRMVWRNLIILAHNAIIIVVIYLAVGAGWHWTLLTLPVAIAVYCINALAIGLVVGVFCTRFRDIVQIIANGIQLLFWVTPIMWKPELLAGRAWIANFNPVYHYIELVRAPLVSTALPTQSWLVVVACTALTCSAAVITLTRFRHRIAYWL